MIEPTANDYDFEKPADTLLTATDNFVWLDEENRFDLRQVLPNTVNDLLRYCHERNVSDVCVKTDSPVFCKKDGKMRRVTNQVLNFTEVERFAQIISRNDKLMATIKSSRDYDTSYEVVVGRREFINFRVNISGISGMRFEVSIVMRAIPSEPPLLSTLNVEEQIIENFFPMSGLIIVTGPTGSGKTTLLASALRYMIEEMPCKIGAYEAPIEFNLSRLDRNNNSFVTQCEVGPGRNLVEFSDAAKNALRNAHDSVLLGEARDFATFRGLAELAEQGTTTYTTMHTNSTYDVFSRIIATIGEENRALLLSVISSLRCVVHQRLVPRLMHAGNKGMPGRVALREYFIVDEECRQMLMSASNERITQVAKELNRRPGFGRMLDDSARLLFEQGEISKETLNTVLDARK